MAEEMTDEMVALAGDLAIVRAAGGRGGAVRDEYLADAEALVGRGWLAREMLDGDAIYTVTDAGLAALGLGGEMARRAADVN